MGNGADTPPSGRFRALLPSLRSREVGSEEDGAVSGMAGTHWASYRRYNFLCEKKSKISRRAGGALQDVVAGGGKAPVFAEGGGAVWLWWAWSSPWSAGGPRLPPPPPLAQVARGGAQLRPLLLRGGRSAGVPRRGTTSRQIRRGAASNVTLMGLHLGLGWGFCHEKFQTNCSPYVSIIVTPVCSCKLCVRASRWAKHSLEM